MYVQVIYLNLFLKVIRADIRERVGEFECGSISKIEFDESEMCLEVPEDVIHGWKMKELNHCQVCLSIISLLLCSLLVKYLHVDPAEMLMCLYT